ncbi:hypothetical protein [Alicyclobacillus sp. SO9]|uniref:hypothetical protein n=1 Tax=Alicyclobacillus sp. SO9 TaxID=2665646 RepID=UPI0018E7E633|nr:hypothetical protein [Alicyclobacillus sp. SO9]QQE78085.1 hypothetical protein GI364_19660 [Alicyclobacillus sp. SO9]
MKVIPSHLNWGIPIMPLILLIVFLAAPAIPVTLVVPQRLRGLRGFIYGVLALGMFYLWMRLVFYTHLFFK